MFGIFGRAAESTLWSSLSWTEPPPPQLLEHGQPRGLGGIALLFGSERKSNEPNDRSFSSQKNFSPRRAERGSEIKDSFIPNRIRNSARIVWIGRLPIHPNCQFVPGVQLVLQNQGEKLEHIQRVPPEELQVPVALTGSRTWHPPESAFLLVWDRVIKLPETLWMSPARMDNSFKLS